MFGKLAKRCSVRMKNDSVGLEGFLNFASFLAHNVVLNVIGIQKLLKSEEDKGFDDNFELCINFVRAIVLMALVGFSLALCCPK